MIEFLNELLASPDVMGPLKEIAGMVLVAVVSSLFAAASLAAKRFFNVQIEAKHMKVLHECVLTWVETAAKEGVTEATDEAIEDLAAYIKESAPIAYAVLRPATAVLKRIATRYLAQRVQP